MITRILVTTFFCLVMSVTTHAQGVKQLPRPEWNNSSDGSITLVDALTFRRSEREFAATPLTDGELSKILWAACGLNRPAEGRITAPSAINAQDITVFVCREDGAWRYDAQNHQLVNVTGKDLRKAVAGRQDFAAKAPVSLVLVSDISKVRNLSELGAMDAGYVSENICLICTAMNLATVPRATMDSDVLKKELGLSASQLPMLNHPIGHRP